MIDASLAMSPAMLEGSGRLVRTTVEHLKLQDEL